VDRFRLVARGPKRIHQFSGEVLVEENLHAAACPWSLANSASTPRTASTVRLG
jgi:uncharacterized protein CbrC (UPF0167 family)